MKPWMNFVLFVLKETAVIALVAFTLAMVIVLVYHPGPLPLNGIVGMAILFGGLSILFSGAPIVLGALCIKVGAAFQPDRFFYWSLSSGIFAAGLTYYLLCRQGLAGEFRVFAWPDYAGIGVITFPALLAWQKLAERHLR